jgi:hypothetical protein
MHVLSQVLAIWFMDLVGMVIYGHTIPFYMSAVIMFIRSKILLVYYSLQLFAFPQHLAPPLVFNISPIIIGLTSDGNRLIFVSSGVLTASATDLLSLDELIFETFTYDVSLNGTTAMTWYAHVVH